MLKWLLNNLIVLDKTSKDGADGDISANVSTILRESSILASFCGMLFGFLLNIAMRPPEFFTYVHYILLLASLYSITIAAAFFIMPVFYHHLHYPYKDLAKYSKRTHQFMWAGVIPSATSLFLGLTIAFSPKIGIVEASILSGIPFVTIYLVFRRVD